LKWGLFQKSLGKEKDMAKSLKGTRTEKNLLAAFAIFLLPNMIDECSVD